MTQKELAYFKKKIENEKNIIKILEESIKMIDDYKLTDFMID